MLSLSCCQTALFPNLSNFLATFRNQDRKPNKSPGKKILPVLRSKFQKSTPKVASKPPFFPNQSLLISDSASHLLLYLSMKTTIRNQDRKLNRISKRDLRTCTYPVTTQKQPIIHHAWAQRYGSRSFSFGTSTGD